MIIVMITIFEVEHPHWLFVYLIPRRFSKTKYVPKNL